MIQTTAAFFTRIMQRWMPDAFIFAILMTVIVLLSGIAFQQQSPVQMIDYWGDGIWKLLSFSMQVMVTLVTGYVLAQTKFVRSMLGSLANIASSPSQAIMLVTFIAMICSWISWGFGLVCGALLAREVAIKVKGVHYPLLVASAYSGFLIWHSGLSGSIPLKIASTDNDAMNALLNGNMIPVSDTIFSWQVITITLVMLFTLPIINRMMLPKKADTIEIPKHLLSEKSKSDKTIETPADKLENSMVISLLLGSMGLAYLIKHFATGGTLSLNIINLSFFTLGILLHKTPANYLTAINDAVKGTAGIILQFPLYAGIMGMMVESGLAASVSEWFVQISTAKTFPILTFFSAGLVNFFVPSGGGQWAVQAPIVIPAAMELGVPLKHAAMAVAFGDAWTNMIQPFWALPLLAIAGLSIKDIMGYCTVCLIWSGLVYCIGMLLLF